MPPATQTPLTAAMIGLYSLEPRSTAPDSIVQSVAAEFLRGARPQLHFALQLKRDLRNVRLEVGADTEVLAPDTGDDGDVGVVVITEVGSQAERSPKKCSMSTRGVARLGTVDRDGDDVIVTQGVIDRTCGLNFLRHASVGARKNELPIA